MTAPRKTSTPEVTSRFEDHFSTHAAAYAQFRPHYPEALYTFLFEQCDRRHLAWDCATGSGQAAIALASRFESVVASDASLRQLVRAEAPDPVFFLQSLAEQAPLPDAGVDLIAVAEAVHWFALDDFYREARRILRPGGLLAVWGYEVVEVSPAVDACVQVFNREVLRDDWPERIHFLYEHYETLPFPFHELTTPAFVMEVEWDLPALLGFISTWSAIGPFTETHGWAPVEDFVRQLTTAWGDPNRRRTCRWPLFMKLGRV